MKVFLFSFTAFRFCFISFLGDVDVNRLALGRNEKAILFFIFAIGIGELIDFVVVIIIITTISLFR